MRNTHHAARLSIKEYDSANRLVAEIIHTLGCSRSEAFELVREQSRRIAEVLRLERSPLVLAGDSVVAEGVAGLLRLAPDVELEIVPKFLSASAPMWREDFLFLATLTRYGSVLAGAGLGLVPHETDDLATLLARAVVRLFRDNARRPVRTYRAFEQTGFALDGDADAEDLLFPTEDGFRQRVVEYSRVNGVNQVISSGVGALLDNVKDPTLRRQLEGVRTGLGPQQRRLPPRPPRLGSRAGHWQPLVDLGWDLLQRRGRSYGPGARVAPGFLVDTWRLWEDVVALASQMGFRGHVLTQHGYRLGKLTRVQHGVDGASLALTATPDVVVHPKGQPAFLIDAKYKSRLGRRERISTSDLYEALAFAEATGIRQVVLAYPLPVSDDSPQPPPGSVNVFARAALPRVEVTAIQVAISGIAQRLAFRDFIRHFAVESDTAIRWSSQPCENCASSAAP